jgi:hypothetical protein
LKKGFTVPAEHIRHFESEPAHPVRAQKGFGGVASGSVGTGRGSRSSGLDVAQTLLAAIRRYRVVVVLRLR